MRFIYYIIIGLISYFAILIPGWFFFVPNEISHINKKKNMTAIEGLFDPGKEPKVK